MDQVVIFKQIFDKVRNDLNYQWFYSELKRHNVSHYIYYLATENVHIVLKNDNNYHLHVTTCIYAIKPRQIINYDAGIVLIDLHQLNVKTTSDNTNQRH